MVADCRSRFSIRPNSARAILFYSQYPNGEADEFSRHGGCPVLKGTKWAANLWVWNAPRGGYPGAPLNPKFSGQEGLQKSSGPQQLQATFTNTGQDETFANADLYYEETYWGPLSHNSPSLSVNTFKGHNWYLKSSDGRVFKHWLITGKEKHVNFFV